MTSGPVFHLSVAGDEFPVIRMFRMPPSVQIGIGDKIGIIALFEAFICRSTLSGVFVVIRSYDQHPKFLTRSVNGSILTGKLCEIIQINEDMDINEKLCIFDRKQSREIVSFERDVRLYKSCRFREVNVEIHERLYQPDEMRSALGEMALGHPVPRSRSFR